jgi:hypothetical protein
MKPATYTTILNALVERMELQSDGSYKLVKYAKTWSIPVTIYPQDLPFAPQEDGTNPFDSSVLN